MCQLGFFRVFGGGADRLQPDRFSPSLERWTKSNYKTLDLIGFQPIDLLLVTQLINGRMRVSAVLRGM